MALVPIEFTRRQVGATEPAWTDIEPVKADLVGERVLTVPRAAGFKFREYASAAFMDTKPVAPPRGRSFCATEDMLTHRILQARTMRDALAMAQDPLSLSEHEQTEKWTFERGAYPGWYVQDGPIGLPGGGDIGTGVRQIFDRLIGAYGMPGPAAPTSYPWRSNSGSPFFTSDPLTKVWSAIVAARCRTWDDVQREFAKAARRAGAPEMVHSVHLHRSGPTRKAWPIYAMVADAMHKVGEAKGYACRRRDVRGVASFINMVLQPHVNRVKALLFSSPRYYHTGGSEVLKKMQDAIDRVARYWGIPRSEVACFEDDISAFDKSVRYIHQLALAAEFFSHLWPAETVHLWLEFTKAAVLSAPVYAHDEAFLYTRPNGGETTSGEIGTTVIGTIINSARIEQCAPVALKTTSGPGEAWDYLAFGDDTIIIAPRARFDTEKFRECSSKIGLESKAREGYTFLMRYMDTTRNRWFPLASRIFQRTTGGEHPPPSSELEMLGLYARTANAKHNPHFDQVWNALHSGDNWFSNGQFARREDLAARLRDPAVAAAIVETQKKRPDALRSALQRGALPVEPDVLAYLQGLFGSDLAEVVDGPKFDWARLGTGGAKGDELAARILDVLTDPGMDKKTREKARKQLLRDANATFGDYLNEESDDGEDT